MATSRQRESGSWEFKVSCKAVRAKPFYYTFDSREDGEAWCARLEGMIRQGLIPPELLEKANEFCTINDVIQEYVKKSCIAGQDEVLLGVIGGRIGHAKLKAVNYEWVEGWVADMKHIRNLSPSTIRHHVGSLARCFDWGTKRGIPELVPNPIRLLPRKYSSYNAHDVAVTGANGGVEKKNESRDRRLEAGEEPKIRLAIKGADDSAASECYFDLAIESAMRMREMYTLTLDQIDFAKNTIFLNKTKNGDKRQVPMTTVLSALLKGYLPTIDYSDGRIFPWWNGRLDDVGLKETTSSVSKHFAKIFDVAGCPDLHFHDLRHEATSRFFERTTVRGEDIMKITGHKSHAMMMRYANLRGSALAGQLW